MNRALFKKFADDRRGNVATIFAFSALPLIFTVGMAVDYGTAARLQSKLNAAADAAVLAAITPAMLNQSDAQAKAAAQNMFNAQVVGHAPAHLRPEPGRQSPRFDNPSPEQPDDAHRQRGLRRAVAERLCRYSQQADTALPWQLDGQRHQPAQHGFLSAARQFAFDGDRRDAGGYPDNGQPYVFAGRLRFRLP